MLIRSIFVTGFLSLALTGCNSSAPTAQVAPDKKSEPAPTETTTTVKSESNRLFLDVKGGRIEIELLPNLAPAHVKRVSTLAAEGFYDGIVFHRVIDGFMAQTGDPTGTGRGGSKLPDLKAEFSDARFERGVLGMARSSSPDSANSQFFIMLGDGDFLNGQYTVFGKVVKGMDFVDAIKKGDKDNNGSVSDPDKILKMQMAPKS